MLRARYPRRSFWSWRFWGDCCAPSYPSRRSLSPDLCGNRVDCITEMELEDVCPCCYPSTTKLVQVLSCIDAHVSTQFCMAFWSFFLSALYRAVKIVKTTTRMDFCHGDTLHCRCAGLRHNKQFVPQGRNVTKFLKIPSWKMLINLCCYYNTLADNIQNQIGHVQMFAIRLNQLKTVN